MRAAAKETTSPARRTAKAGTRTDYLHDLFFSYDVSMSQGVLAFTDRLKQELTVLRGKPPNTFIDVQEVRAGDVWPERLSEALLRSKVLVAFITPRYLASQFADKEFQAFSERARMTGKPVLVPILVRDAPLPADMREITWLDLRRIPLQRAAERQSIELERQIQELAKRLSTLIDDAPPFDSSWRALSESIYRSPVAPKPLPSAP